MVLLIGLVRQCRAERTDIRVCLPMVPAPPGNGVVPHFQRPVHCWCTVAASLRTHDRAVRVAIDNGGLRGCCRWDRSFRWLSSISKPSQPSHQPASLPGRNQSNARPALSPNVFFLSLLIASFLCCIPMADAFRRISSRFAVDLGMLTVRGASALIDVARMRFHQRASFAMGELDRTASANTWSSARPSRQWRRRFRA